MSSSSVAPEADIVAEPFCIVDLSDAPPGCPMETSLSIRGVYVPGCPKHDFPFEIVTDNDLASLPIYPTVHGTPTILQCALGTCIVLAGNTHVPDSETTVFRTPPGTVVFLRNLSFTPPATPATPVRRSRVPSPENPPTDAAAVLATSGRGTPPNSPGMPLSVLSEPPDSPLTILSALGGEAPTAAEIEAAEITAALKAAEEEQQEWCRRGELALDDQNHESALNVEAAEEFWAAIEAGPPCRPNWYDGSWGAGPELRDSEETESEYMLRMVDEMEAEREEMEAMAAVEAERDETGA
ncbi:hypothetical protein BJ912DRAFT_933029 [Pholiota molesta]|nr:hypothetical protein BJ912DRAFT_933029 [Pholiota molesta]